MQAKETSLKSILVKNDTSLQNQVNQLNKDVNAKIEAKELSLKSISQNVENQVIKLSQDVEAKETSLISKVNNNTKQKT